jgi:diguanylate cyclase (GGDEF)-like protein
VSRLIRLFSWLTLTSTPPDVAVAQMRELRRQIPFLYALLAINAGAVAYTHYDSAPTLLTVVIPVTLIVLCAARTVAWLRLKREDFVTPEQAITRLRRTTYHAAIVSVGFVSWSLALDKYGGPFERAHVAVFIAVTVIGCIVCLMRLPQAALAVTTVVTVPYLIHYVSDGNAVFIAIACNVALVMGVMIRVLLTSFGGFTALVRSRGTLERLSSENARVAHTDSLTGLPNRRFFFSRLEEVLREKKACHGRFAVGVIDLDRFKPLNDTYGHAFGDRLLIQVGARLGEAADDRMIVARLGGDEFGILLLDGADRATAVGQRFCDLLSKPFYLDDIQVSIRASCGVAIYPDAGTSAHELFDRSDYALYHMKSEQRGGSGLFSLAHETMIRTQRAVETALQSADLAVELDVHFQPIVDTDEMKVVAVEALARWTSPTIGIVAPDEFIATAERIGLIHAVTIVLFGKVLDHARCLPQDIGLSFNLSANDISSPATIESLMDMMAAAPIDPSRITFELTETVLVRDFEMAEAATRSLRALGAHVALDDFGTGYSSLSYLRRLPLDRIKVDRSFVADLDSISGRNIVIAIAGLCANLGLECIMEGIESSEQLAQVRRFGYRLVQGYLFARPMSMPSFLLWLERDALQEFAAVPRSAVEQAGMPRLVAAARAPAL